jgi:hypothetical protein
MTLGGDADDRFGFGAFVRFCFWPCVIVGGGGGLMAQTVLDRRRPWSRGHVLETGDHRRRLNSDVVFAMLLALALPFYPLFYGWFAFI